MDKEIITPELEQYILDFCYDYMLKEEIQALRQLSLAECGRESTGTPALLFPQSASQSDFDPVQVKKLVALGLTQLRIKIAARIAEEHKEAVLNFCKACGKLARTPKAKQCRHCGHDWH